MDIHDAVIFGFNGPFLCPILLNGIDNDITTINPIKK